MVLVLLLVFIGLSALLAVFLVSNDHGQREPIYALWMAVGLGVAASLFLVFAEGRIIPANNLLPTTPLGKMFLTCVGIGVIEETFKFLPLALVLYGRRYFNEYTDGVIYFALAGLGFGLPENILYTLQYGPKTGFARLFLTPIFHAAITGMVGYYLVRQKLAHKSPLFVIVPFTVAILLHALYDFGLSSGVMLLEAMSILITVCLSAMLFFLFLRATEHDQELGLSVVGHNAFCRTCGWPNPRHHLYCVQCGKNA